MVHPIEARSYEIMEGEVDFSSWAPGAREIVKRMVHATADDSFARTALVGSSAVDAGGVMAAFRAAWIRARMAARLAWTGGGESADIMVA